MSMKKAMIAVAVMTAMSPALAAPLGGGGPFSTPPPFPVTANGGAACYDDALASSQPVDRYADWQNRHPGNCQTRWEDVPEDRRA